MIWHPFTQHALSPEMIPISHGKNTLLFTTNQKIIIDAISSWWVNLHGHANESIANAISKQAHLLEQVIFAGFSHEPALKLDQYLTPILPGNMSHLFFSDNGSTSVEVAVKMTIQFFHNQGIRKQKFIAFENSYHGDTFGAMSVSDRSIFNLPFFDYLFEVIRIPVPTLENIDELLDIVSQLAKNQNIAAIIFEPLVQGAGGMNMYPANLLDELLGTLRKHEVLLIADEVMTGFGRTGKIFASQELKHSPDIICLSKGLTGGFLPLGITACKNEIYDIFYSQDLMKTFFHGHSYTGNPLSCAAAVASLELTLSEHCLEQRLKIEEQHWAFHEIISENPLFQNSRIKGTIWAAELQTPQKSYQDPIGKIFMKYALEEGVLLRPLGNTVYVLPPYCITANELEKVYHTIMKIANQIASSN